MGAPIRRPVEDRERRRQSQSLMDLWGSWSPSWSPGSRSGPAEARLWFPTHRLITPGWLLSAAKTWTRTLASSASGVSQDPAV